MISEEGAPRSEAIEQTMADAANYLATIPAATRRISRAYYNRDGYYLWIRVAYASLQPRAWSMLTSSFYVGIGKPACADGVSKRSATGYTSEFCASVILNEPETETLALDGTRPLRILVPLDGSFFAESVLAPTLSFARALCCGRNNANSA